MRAGFIIDILDMTPEYKKTNSRFKLKLLLLLFVVLIAALGYRLLGEWGKRRDIEDEVSRLQDEAKRLENRNLEILELSKQLTEEEFLEREARLKLGLQKPGESVAVLSKDSQPEIAAIKEAEGSRGGNARRWWFYFFDQEKLKALREERKAKIGPQAEF